MSVHTTGSFKDMLAAALVTEPLMNYLPDGTPIPNLVKEVPSLENGLLAEVRLVGQRDGRSVRQRCDPYACISARGTLRRLRLNSASLKEGCYAA